MDNDVIKRVQRKINDDAEEIDKILRTTSEEELQSEKLGNYYEIVSNYQKVYYIKNNTTGALFNPTLDKEGITSLFRELEEQNINNEPNHE